MAENLPAQGGYFDASLQQLYEDSIDQLIADLGYQVTLNLPSTETECPNCGVGWDLKSDGVYETSHAYPTTDPRNQYFPAGATCPVCQGSHKLFAESSIQYTALVKNNPKEWETDAAGITKMSVVRLKTRVEALEDIKNSKSALIEGVLYKMIQDPTKTGLQTRTYVVSYWQRMDG
jgi:rubredoxin